ncbi:MAG: Cytosine deaminase (EC [uncultured Campylobacterales bacterium]|uniref:Cytosine deaminase (EC) n=1 Tax=uncultured Campylobacterales bacterium TaxID=352960 RepID=A0A6S6SLJ5_9BACT|nr:MAG: Cytosine deaminase (EC [uncultured Campylobacterales bacterium]
MNKINFSLKSLDIKFSYTAIKKNVLLSLGNITNKQKLLPYIKKLASLNVVFYATEGTSEFLNTNNIENKILNKINTNNEPNINTFLQDQTLDFVINILTGDDEYDEKSDNNRIRKECINNNIALFSDAQTAMIFIDSLIEKKDTKKSSNPWDLKSTFLDMVHSNGGFCSYHAHFDKAYVINEDSLKLSQSDMQYKWKLYRYLKENYTHEDLIKRMSTAIEMLIAQGVTYCRSFIDADSIIKLKGMEAALEVREKYKNDILIEYAVQPLEGVLDPHTRKYFDQACKMADIIGGLPSRDRPSPDKHLDYILQLGKELGKPVDVHIDQENNPDEHETELLAKKTIEHGMQSQVYGVHAISLAAQSQSEQKRVIDLIKEADMGIIICPSAAISMKPLDKLAPLHNSIAPLNNLLDADINLFLGIDNIADLFMPMVDGDMYTESRLLMEACRFYDIETVAKIATNRRGIIKDKLLNI